MIVWVRIAQIWTVVATDVAKAKAGTAEPGRWGGGGSLVPPPLQFF